MARCGARCTAIPTQVTSSACTGWSGVAFVVMSLARASRRSGKIGASIQRLDLGLLVDAQDDGIGGGFRYSRRRVDLVLGSGSGELKVSIRCGAGVRLQIRWMVVCETPTSAASSRALDAQPPGGFSVLATTWARCAP